jgi:L-ascorbate metabolism protein UlaG (beta-lactamase superfamily)
MNKLIIIILISQLAFFTKSFAQENIAAEITYIGNEGFMITKNDKKILIDALYNNTANNGIVNIDDSLSNLIMTNQQPFANCNLYLVTHAHSDHYDKTMVSSYLKNNSQVMLIADSTIIKPLGTSFVDQLFSATPDKYQSIDTTLNGIQLSVYNLKHNSVVKIYNVGYWVNIEGLKIFHSGDNILEDTTEYINTNLFSKQVDVAFLNYNGFLKSTIYSDFIINHMKPRSIVLMHIPNSQLSSVKDKVSKLVKNYPPIHVFDISMEKITISNQTNITKEKIQSIALYPNPAFNQLWINKHVSSDLKVQIFDLQGRIIFDRFVKTNPIDISNLSKGPYILQIIESGNVTKQKLVKQ